MERVAMGDDAETTVGGGRPALIYARESQHNERERTEVEAQLAACRALAERLGYTIADETTLVDRGANTSMARPGLTALIGLVAGGRVSAVVTYSLDRLGRPENDALEALLRELRRRAVPIYLARMTRGYRYDPATGELIADAAEVHAANREDWRPPEFIIIPRENEQDDLIADRLTLSPARRAQHDAGSEAERGA